MAGFSRHSPCAFASGVLAVTAHAPRLGWRESSLSPILHGLETPIYDVSDDEVRRRIQDRSGLRRCNLDRFPYHFLYDIRGEYVRMWVLRHDHWNPDFDLKRFSK